MSAPVYAGAGHVEDLRRFYRDQRDHRGTYMGATENVWNATERRLSCRTDDELVALRNAALRFVEMVDNEWGCRL